MKMKSLKKQKHAYLIHTWSDKAFKGRVVHRALPSLHGWSLEIKRSVPLKVSTHLKIYMSYFFLQISYY